MTRVSETFLPTIKEAPHDARALSHKLLVRGGFVRQLGAGLWSYLPAGWRVHRAVEQILRQEMEAIGAQEVSIPILQPAEPWERTGRYGLAEMFELEDRRGAPMVLAMTHEEAMTLHVAADVRSYRDLPRTLFQIQSKNRDEPRPRAGILRTREFRMKDSYSFDRDEDGLDAAYERHRKAYARIFDRCGLRWYEVESDVGMMGGAGAHEYMAPCEAGEDSVALAGPYAANVEIASADPQPVELPEPLEQPVEVETPGMTTVDDVSGHLEVPAGALIKALPVVAEASGLNLVVVRGDHELAETKLTNEIGPFRPAVAEEIEESLGPVGFIGPVGVDVPILIDRAIAGEAFVAGANRPDRHLIGVRPGRDFTGREVDVRRVVEGDSVDGVEIRIEPAIEVGNIFKLGTRYSEPLGATYLDQSGRESLIVMGSYGIGPARVMAAAVEQRADDRGIVWPRSLAPWEVQLVAIGRDGGPERAAADDLYLALMDSGFDVLYDDRDAGPGEKLTDAELLGCPVRVVVGKRGLANGVAEAESRDGSNRCELALGAPVEPLREMLEALDRIG